MNYLPNTFVPCDRKMVCPCCSQDIGGGARSEREVTQGKDGTVCGKHVERMLQRMKVFPFLFLQPSRAAINPDAGLAPCQCPTKLVLHDTHDAAKVKVATSKEPFLV